MDQIPYGETRFYQGELIRCQSYYDDYTCSCGGVIVSDGDGMDSNTQVSVVRCTWVPVVMSYRDRHLMPLFPEDLAPAPLLDTEKPPGRNCRGPGYVSSQVIQKIYSGQTGGEILSVRAYRDGWEDRYRSFLGLVLFRLVVPPLKPEVMGPYLVWGGWFPSRLLLEGTGRIQTYES
jgi:hypothetical protein